MDWKNFYSPKIEKQNSKKVSSKLMNTLSIPDKKTKYNIKQSKLDKQAKSPQINQRNSFSLLKSFDSKVFRTSTNIPLNVKKLIKVSTEYSMFNDIKSEIFWFKNFFSDNNNYLKKVKNILK